MSKSEPKTVKACPHGHISVFKRTQLTDAGGLNGGVAKTEYYCRSCAHKKRGIYRNPHYERGDLIDKPRRVNADREYDVTLGYVWSPSHDE